MAGVKGTSEVLGSLVLPWDRRLGSGMRLELRLQRVGGERPPSDLPPFPPFPVGSSSPASFTPWGTGGDVFWGTSTLFLQGYWPSRFARSVRVAAGGALAGSSLSLEDPV